MSATIVNVPDLADQLKLAEDEVRTLASQGHIPGARYAGPVLVGFNDGELKRWFSGDTTKTYRKRKSKPDEDCSSSTVNRRNVEKWLKAILAEGPGLELSAADWLEVVMSNQETFPTLYVLTKELLDSIGPHGSPARQMASKLRAVAGKTHEDFPNLVVLRRVESKTELYRVKSFIEED